MVCSMQSENGKQKNSDLIWELDKLKQQQLAISFIQQLENRFCVFSPAIRQLYTNYSIFFPKSENLQMVILPDPYAFHDTFSYVSSDAATPTGLHIIPGNLISKRGLYLVISRKDKNVRSVPIPFQEGLKQILNRSDSEDPFLPVLMKGDLRELNNAMPSLHLHRLRLSKLESLSELERKSIRTIVTDKLMALYEEASSMNLSLHQPAT